MKNVLDGVENLGARSSDIHWHENLDFAGFSKLHGELLSKANHYVYDAKERGREEHVVIIYYYGGHGLQDNFTYALCNKDPSGRKSRYGIEVALRNLGLLENVFVLGILDCCREKISGDMA